MATRSRRVYASPKRKTFWVRDAQNISPDTAAQALDLLRVEVVEEDNLAAHTITRCFVNFYFDQTGSQLSNRTYAGVAVLPSTHIGITPPETPLTTANTTDWMAWGFETTAGFGAQAATGAYATRMGFDIKSQRVIESAKESLLFVYNFEGQPQHTGLVVSSVLVKRP